MEHDLNCWGADCATSDTSSQVDQVVGNVLLNCVPLIGTGRVFTASVAGLYIARNIFIDLSTGVVKVLGFGLKGKVRNWVFVMSHS